MELASDLDCTDSRPTWSKMSANSFQYRDSVSENEENELTFALHLFSLGNKLLSDELFGLYNIFKRLKVHDWKNLQRKLFTGMKEKCFLGPWNFLLQYLQLPLGKSARHHIASMVSCSYNTSMTDGEGWDFFSSFLLFPRPLLLCCNGEVSWP